MADPFKEAMGRAMAPEPKEESRGGGDGESGGAGALQSVHHFAAGGKHHVVKHGKSGVEHSEHEAGSGGDTCPLCGGSGEAPKD